MNLFERASRQQYRFPSPKGDLTVEQLWQLPLQSTKAGHADLDTVAKAINRGLKAQAEESFVDTTSNASKDEEAKLAIVVHIIGVKKAENAAALQRAEKATMKARLREVLAIRTQEDLLKKTPEELQSMLEALDKETA